jgi:uncharacterized protein DUF4388
MVQLIGNLNGIGFAPLLQFLTELRVTGRLGLTVVSGISTGSVYLEDGSIVGASLDAEEGLVALEAVALMSNKASFMISDSAGELRRNLDLDTAALLEHLDHLGREGDRLLSNIGSLQSVPRLTLGDENPREPVAVSRGALRLLLDLRTQRTVLEMGHLHGLRSTLEELQELVDLRLVSVTEADPAPPVTQLLDRQRIGHLRT